MRTGPILDDLVVRQPALGPAGPAIGDAFDLLARTFRAGHTVLICGNGGSAADAEHIVGELMKGMSGRRRLPSTVRSAVLDSAPPAFATEASYLAGHLEPGLRALSLCSQASLLTAVANDTGGDMGFAQQVLGYGRAGDLLWVLSTSGRSRNVVLAALTARAVGMPVLALTGDPGEPLAGLADVAVRVPATDVARVQELHVAVYHALCEALETELFDRRAESS